MAKESTAPKSVLKSTILAVEGVVAKLTKARVELAAAVDAARILDAAPEAVLARVAQLEVELEELQVKHAEVKRQAEVQLQIDLKEAELQTVTAVLVDQGKTAINSDELLKLRTELQTLQAELKNQIAAEVGKAQGIARSQLEAALREKDLKTAAESAEQKAQINSLTEKNTLLAKQVVALEGIISAERQARVEEAKARGTAMVTVNSGK